MEMLEKIITKIMRADRKNKGNQAEQLPFNNSFIFLLYRKQYETLSYATQSENKLQNIQKAYIMDMSSIK